MDKGYKDDDEEEKSPAAPSSGKPPAKPPRCVVEESLGGLCVMLLLDGMPEGSLKRTQDCGQSLPFVHGQG